MLTAVSELALYCEL